MKLNEFKKAKLNELDLSSFIGDYGSAATRTGLGSLKGKNVLSTQDQMAKDEFTKNFTSRAFNGLQSAINSGLVDTNITGQSVQQANTTNAIAQKRIAAQKAQTDAIRDPSYEGPKYDIDPNKQMQPKVAGTTSKTPEQIRQEKLAAASKAAQGQLTPVSKLPADQFAKSASNVRKQQQGVATQKAQGQMTGNVAPATDNTKPDNTVQMPKRNVKPRNAGKNAFGQMAQNLGKVAEGSRFDKLNYIFESILAEQDPETGATKQTISQYITNFFRQFMKGVDIDTDPTVKTQVASLSKELEQTYAKDKGKTVLPKLADLGWSVSQVQQDTTTSGATQNTQAATQNTQDSTQTSTQNTQAATQAATQKTVTAYKQIQGLLKDLTPANKQKILTGLQKELANKSDLSVGGQKLDPNNPADAKMLDLIKKQGRA